MTKHMQTVNPINRLLNTSSKMSILLLYRTLSLALTSLFFYLLGPQLPLLFKTGVVASLSIAAWIVTDLQKKHVENKQFLKAIILIETTGLILLLIPTGGISSPFIWYALNPVLVAAIFLTPFFSFGVLTFYFGSATSIANQLFHYEIADLLKDKSYFYLVCMLTTLLVWLFSRFTKEVALQSSLLMEQKEKLLIVNEKLTDSNMKYEETLEHIMSLYYLMDSYSSMKSPNKLIQKITAALQKCAQTDSAFFWLSATNDQTSYLENLTNNSHLETDLMNVWDNFRDIKEPFIGTIKNERYWLKIIRTSKNIGVLGFQISQHNENEKSFLVKRTFEFLAELSEIMLEGIHMNQMTGQMQVIEEQNRIANEIHDSVSQRLFGIVYSLHNLKVKGPALSERELDNEYKFLSESANTTIKELRKAIYRLSSIKNEEQPFLVHLKSYLHDYARLNDIRINYQITGDENLLSNDLKSALYRIICEACGNSVRHGNCSEIELTLLLVDKKTTLIIQDDGVGIDDTLDQTKIEKGLGLYNIKRIISSYNGTFSIDGASSLGTKVSVEIPVSEIQIKQEVAI
ncbi:sensor histidine kinase [Sporosarcina sp. CAU 1771]